ncbi:BspA family leucine-rich repeat surface protein [Dyadobacter sp. CY347]|uniref:BspA family leucine-rich repeat surface protein n=1 Tax=Dyadobacter sp. CY347 TaxID=2909336 RepID=UPI001F471295|nr:BspA family leucine-rich repeat surface protein [Dyadobacter sp. CY347]MCF2488050.1 BspA family leucine-rich repeat surface protein [Dyadobacter sp. CY347]
MKNTLRISMFRKTAFWIARLHYSAFIIIALLLLFKPATVTAQKQAPAASAFITTWQTTTRENPTAKHIIFPGWGRNYTIFWTGRVGGRTMYGQLTGNGATRIDFPAPGTYQVRVGPGSGTFYRFMMHESEKTKLLRVDQWGSVVWSSMGSAFKNCYNMDVVATDIPDLSQVIDMSSMFEACLVLTGNARFNDWNTSNVRIMKNLFDGAHHFNQSISNWNTGNVTDMSNMFHFAWIFNQPVGNWNTEKVINMSYMFAYTSAFNQPIGNWNTANVANMSHMFESAQAFNQPIGNWNTANVLNINNMFSYTKLFNQPINSWNTSKVTDMSSLFYFAMAFNQHLANWDTGNVTNMTAMFCYNQVFNQPIGNWNTQNVTDMHLMFSMASAFNQPIGGWDTEKVTNMRSMFNGIKIFNQPLGNWNTAAVTNMTYMFYGAASFNQPLENWNTSRVTDMAHMFDDATSFNQPVKNWNTAAVTDMAYMFRSAAAFDQPLGNWQVGNVKSMYMMLDSTDMSKDNYDQMFIHWERQTLQPRVVLGAATLTYCKGATFRNLIVYRNGWVILGDRKDCSDCPGCRTSPDDAVAISKKQHLDEFSKSKIGSEADYAYPNPASDKLYIKNNSGTIHSVSITDAAGRTRLTHNTTNNNPDGAEISTTHLPSGVYLLTLFQNNGSSKSQKIIITKTGELE